MSLESSIKTSREMMDKAINHLEVELGRIRTGKANPAMLDSVMVDYYGAMTPLNQIANCFCFYIARKHPTQNPML